MAVYEKWPTIKYAPFTVGKDDVGHDVKFYGATSGKYFLWDESEDTLVLNADVTLTGDVSHTGTQTFSGLITANAGILVGSATLDQKLYLYDSGVYLTVVSDGKLTIRSDGTTYDSIILNTGTLGGVKVTGTLNVGLGKTEKLFFWDTDVYLRSDTDGHLKISADSATYDAIWLNGKIALGGEVYIGYGTLDTKIRFYDSGIYINAPSDGQLRLATDGTGADAIHLSTGGGVQIDGTLCLQPGTTKKLSFWDTDVYLSSPTDGKLTIAANSSAVDAIKLDGKVDITGAVRVGDGTLDTKITFYDSAVYITSHVDGKIRIGVDSTAADAIHLSTGITGGVTVQYDLAVGDDLSVSGTGAFTEQLNANAITVSSSISTGAFVCDGGVGIAKELYVGLDFYLASGKKIDFAAGDVTITHSSGVLAFAGATGGITFDDKVTVTSTAPTAAENTVAGIANLTTTWASGEVNSVYGKTTITVSGADETYNAAGGHFEMTLAGHAGGGGQGLLCATMIKLDSNYDSPNAILYIESYPHDSADFSITPFITFVDYTGYGTQSNILFKIGDGYMGASARCSTGSGKMYHNETLQIEVNTGARYIPLSTSQTVFASAYPINLTYGGTALDITSTITAADIIASITVADSGTQGSDGRGIGLFVDYVMSNDKTATYGVRSTRVNTQILGDVYSVICGDWYIHAIDNKAITLLMGLSMYWEDYGSAVQALCMLDMGINSVSGTVSDRHTFIRCREHITVQDDSSILRLEGQNAAEFLVWFDTISSNKMILPATHQSGATDYKIAVHIDGLGDRYIELCPA